MPVSDESETEEFTVELDVSELSQDYFTIPAEKIKANNPEKLPYKVSGLDKSVVIVGTEKALESITDDLISVEVDLSSVKITEGQTVSVPVNVILKSANCWVYGSYTAEVTL